ncbi:LLM class flavin-dependent oxidoreductase [Actinomycetospora sp. TBRC 11914]|uniref:LLM class flavin-dependent oxidoreductase n=1 Tax=Actinomycetospora sp. TBRC 11914 TaxID=2729387 RepID=UPI00145F4915|nr:LLM class flavin-dependent oxidoreductase [Actinomycetospora sp. TBRC 11914]NMO88772.1 LLM class flavin-dependent oxidoreductase [Actinomycetospora sp. TBRC 11914]
MGTERLGLTVIPGAGWRAEDVRRVAREAEHAGFDAIFSTEVNSDTMSTALLMGGSTERIGVGTWVANIYLRHPYLCAKGAELIADATDGRFLLGLGVSHQPVNAALQIDMSDAGNDLGSYARAVRGWLEGGGPTTHLPQRPAPRPVPIYVAALSFAAVERAAEVADGLMPTMWSPERVAESVEHIARGRRRAQLTGDVDLTLGIPTFMGEDLDRLREIARENLALYTGFPFFRRMWHESGFVEEAEAMARGAGARGLSDALLDSFCLIGPPSRCRERIARYRSAGVDLPILMPPLGPRAALEVVDTFATVAAQ